MCVLVGGGGGAELREQRGRICGTTSCILNASKIREDRKKMSKKILYNQLNNRNCPGQVILLNYEYNMKLYFGEIH